MHLVPFGVVSPYLKMPRAMCDCCLSDDVPPFIYGPSVPFRSSQESKRGVIGVTHMPLHDHIRKLHVLGERLGWDFSAFFWLAFFVDTNASKLAT